VWVERLSIKKKSIRVARSYEKIKESSTKGKLMQNLGYAENPNIRRIFSRKNVTLGIFYLYISSSLECNYYGHPRGKKRNTFHFKFK